MQPPRNCINPIKNKGLGCRADHPSSRLHCKAKTAALCLHVHLRCVGNGLHVVHMDNAGSILHHMTWYIYIIWSMMVNPRTNAQLYLVGDIATPLKNDGVRQLG